MLGRVPGVRLAAQSLARRSGPLVLFDSWRGAYSDNPRAVSETLHALRPELPQVWVGDGPDHAERVAAGSRAHLRALGAATHVVTNLEMPGYFRKRADTVYVQTWHGTPVKKLAFDVADPHFAPNARYMRRLARDIADWDFLVSPNPFSTRLFRQAFRYEGAVLETGYPRNDLLRAPDAAAIRERVRAQLGIEGRAVLYMPTWRDSAAFELELDFARLQAPGTTLLFRAHHKAPVGVPDGVIDVTRHPDNRELYLAADVLITDYSSAVFDFAVTGKPILLYVYDLAYYRDELRGLYLDLTREAPGPVLETSEAVAGALADLDATSARYGDAYARFAERFCALEDGRAAERVIDAVF